MVRPVARGVLKTGVLAYEKARESAAEFGEFMEDLVAEVQDEMQQAREHAAPRRRPSGPLAKSHRQPRIADKRICKTHSAFDWPKGLRKADHNFSCSVILAGALPPSPITLCRFFRMARSIRPFRGANSMPSWIFNSMHPSAR